ncbi:MAG: glycogen/starch/alpha-glucan phosphorylase [Pseudomarimonas sp.]
MLQSHTQTAALQPCNRSTAAASDAVIDAFRSVFHSELAQASDPSSANACLRAAASACREVLKDRWAQTQVDDAARGVQAKHRRVHYLSMEFLMGRALGNALAALGLTDELRALMAARSIELDQVLESEPDAALGNGGLGRLAACFLDSFAQLGLPSFGYGLRYQYGMFAQAIADGRQLEAPDDWMRRGEPWDVARADVSWRVGFGGRIHADAVGAGRWVPTEQVIAHAHDFIVPAHGGERVSTLRQWHATSAEPIDFAAFCRGEFAQAARHRQSADALNWVLYPDDSTDAGRELRLKQEAFLVSASLQDLLARHVREFGSVHDLGLRNAIHLNDTHPALAPAELMRLLLDEHGLTWDEAWAITRQAVSYTNHTLMPEALESWPVRMFEHLLPRHLEIIFAINQRFLDEVRQRFPGDEGLAARVSLIDERGDRRVRMASLAIAASQRVNGVAALHSKLMVQTIFADYSSLFSERFLNVTNGVTPRRWLMQANPALSSLIDAHIGPAWRADLGSLRALAGPAESSELGAEFLAVKRANKQQLAALIRRELGVVVDTDSLFDVQIKRIHEYKRQLLNILHVVARYHSILANPDGPDGLGWTPRTVIIAGKAASAYHVAKQIIQLAHDVGRMVNSDPRVGRALKLVFLPNYSVSLAEIIIPAADLSEQISTAGTEASGTGNMKFAMNGACTIGTWDGATIEMAEAIGVEHMFVFGLRAEQVTELRALGYDPTLIAQQNPLLRRVLDSIASGMFNRGEPDRYRGLIDSLLKHDRYLLLADFASYVQTQGEVDQLFRMPTRWAKRALRNIAGMGSFSTDRTVAEYAEKVWSVARAQAERDAAKRDLAKRVVAKRLTNA